MSSLPKSGDSRQQWVRLLEEAGKGRLDELEKLLASDSGGHVELLRLLTHLELEEPAAREHWAAILQHRKELSRKLGREASLQVAALDYFQSVQGSMTSPKLIEMNAFLTTERNAITDGLTGLYNRQFFDASLRRELKRSRRYGLAFSLVMLDLDDFKAVNDAYGHIVGDDALVAASEVITASVREIDVACRYGGEEFAVILPETSRTGAFIVSERIRSDMKEVFDQRSFGVTRVTLSVSGGIAIYPTDSNSAEGLVRMADKALYRSKHEGKNKITLHAEEKRRSPRLESRKLLVFRERKSSERQGELRSETKNLSRNGALVESQVPLTVGTELEIDIHLPQTNTSFFVKGRVVRLEETSETDERSRYHLGVAFIADTDEDARKLERLAMAIYGPIEDHETRRDGLDRIS